jgi:hypothetical protein
MKKKAEIGLKRAEGVQEEMQQEWARDIDDLRAAGIGQTARNNGSRRLPSTTSTTRYSYYSSTT